MKQKNKYWQRRLLPLLLCAMCALGFAGGSLAMEITPLDETTEDLYLFARDLGDTGYTLMIAIPYTRTAMAVEEEDFQQMLALSESEAVTSFFSLAAFRPEKGATKDLENWTAEDFLPVFQRILSAPGDMSLTYQEAYDGDLEAMRITFDNDQQGRHLAGFRDDWLMVLSCFPGAENTDMEALEKYESVMFRYMLQPYQGLPQVRTIALEDSSLTATLPEGMRATVDRYDEYTHEELVLYFLHPPKPDDQAAVMYLTTVRKEAYQGKALHQLTGEELNEAAGRFPLGDGELQVDWLATTAGEPILLIREMKAISGEENGSDAYHLIYMQDSWLLGITVLDSGRWPLGELLTLQVNVMGALLAGDGQPVSLEPGTILHPTLGGTLEMDIPYGYYPMAQAMEGDSVQYTLMDMSSPSKYYSLVCTTKADFAGETILTRQDQMEEAAQQLGASTGEEATFQMLEEGYLGVPTGMIATASQSIQFAYFIKDGCMVNLGLQVRPGPPSQEELEALPTLLRYEESK